MDRDTVSWYEEYTSRYIDRTRSFELFQGLEQDLATFIGFLRNDAIVMDLGSGSGRDAQRIAGAGHIVVAVDASRGLLRRCLAATQRMRTVLGVNADMLALPFACGSFGGIWACGSLVHLSRDEIPVVVSRCFDLLKPGTPIGLSMKKGVGSERRGDGRLFTYTNKVELAGWLSYAGFERIDITGPFRNEWLLAMALKPDVS